jgi:hypothetical protein
VTKPKMKKKIPIIATEKTYSFLLIVPGILPDDMIC